MNAITAATAAPAAITPTGAASPAVLRVSLLVEAASGLAAGIVLSMQAPQGSEIALQFAAGGAVLAAIGAAIAARGVRRQRGWAWTFAAVIQVLVVTGIAVAAAVGGWHSVLLGALAVAAVVTLLLSTPTAREALGQA